MFLALWPSIYVAELAEIALKFLELLHWIVEASVTTSTGEIPGNYWCNTSGFEIELQTLKEFILFKFMTIDEELTILLFIFYRNQIL